MAGALQWAWPCFSKLGRVFLWFVAGGGPSGAHRLAAGGTQQPPLGDDVCPAAQWLLAALTDKVLPVPRQVLHALEVL